MQLPEHILKAVLEIRDEFNAANPDMHIDRIELAGMMGEAISTLCTFNDDGLKKLLTSHAQQTGGA